MAVADRKQLREAFKLFDTDNDDKISAQELCTVLRSLGYNPSPTEVRARTLPRAEAAAGRETQMHARSPQCLARIVARTRQVAEIIAKQAGVSVQKKDITVPDMKAVGTGVAKIKLHKEVTAELKIVVVPA